MEIKELLALRSSMKKRKPNFIRQDINKRKNLEPKWVKPRGRHSKLRNQKRGRGSSPSIGYSSPKAVRGLTKEGYKHIVVNNLNEIKQIKDPFFISSRVGNKTRLEMLRSAKQKGLMVLNFKDLDKALKNVEDRFAESKALKKDRIEKKAKIKEKKEEKKEESLEEKAVKEKELKRKVLEQK